MNVFSVLLGIILCVIGIILILFEGQFPLGALVVFINILVFIVGEQEIH